jgi:hypothetical protein
MQIPILEFFENPAWPPGGGGILGEGSGPTYIQGTKLFHRALQHFLWFITISLSALRLA